MSIRRKTTRRRPTIIRVTRPKLRRRSTLRAPRPSKKALKSRYYRRKKRSHLKGVNKRRARLALDPVPIRRHEVVNGTRPTQWSDYTAAATRWSYVRAAFRVVQATDDDYSLTGRPGHTARFLPSVFILRITHSSLTAERGEATYRVLMLKFLEMARVVAAAGGTAYDTLEVDGVAVPREYILQRASDANEWRHSRYAFSYSRPENFPSFSVVYDKVFTFNNAGDRSSTKMLKIPIRGGRVDYAEDQTDGSYAKGHYVLLVLTTAGAQTAYRTFDFDYMVQFTSSGG